MAKATRLVVALRQSPQANTPGRLVSRGKGGRFSGQTGNSATGPPVRTKPLASLAIDGGRNSVLGLAPMKTKSPHVGSLVRSPFSFLSVTASICFEPSTATTLVQNLTLIRSL